VGQEQVLADRYTLVSPLGRGGMGQVWEALDTRLDRKVAVKLLTAGAFMASPDFGLDARRFTREAAVTAGFTHPSVPTIFDAGIYDGGLYLVMELVDGCTIGDLVAEHGPLPVAWAAGIAGQVAAVLAIAHQRQILHRDIKPQNVMLTRDGTAKVLDFGVAGIISQRITSTGVTVGTPGYIAPEQLHNLPATPQTDLYALGCLLYEMLAGEPVFTATSAAGLIRMHLEQAPSPLHRRDVPPRLQALLWQLLDKDPAQRPTDARQAYDLLLPFVSSPGPLGDIDPEAGSRTGMQLYSRLLARLSGADPGEPGLPVSRPAMPASRARNDAGWTVRHSLWLLPALLFGGLGAWLSFGYIAARHQRLVWLATAAAYLALTVAAFVFIAVSPNSGNGPLAVPAIIGVSLLAALWPAAIIHALWVNFKSRLPLLSTWPGRHLDG
jgi:serine/threonine protein kinase